MTFAPLFPLWIVLSAATALLAFMLTIEWRRPLRLRVARCAACVIAVASLTTILLRPGHWTTHDEKAIILTSSYRQTIVDSLTSLHRDAAIYHLGTTPYRHSSPLNSYRDVLPSKGSTPTTADNASSSSNPVGSVIAIVGNGLPTFALDSLPHGFMYLPAPPEDGITAITYSPRELQVGQPVVVSGRYHIQKPPVTAYFIQPSGKKDSVSLATPRGTFSFDFIPRTSGQLTCRLVLSDRDGKRIEETLPLTIAPFRPLNIILLQSFPTFEMQHLKNFLSDRGHRISMRAQLSRNTYRTEHINRPAQTLNKITASLLDECDLVIADPGVWKDLSQQERSIVSTALRNGLGVMTHFDGIPQKLTSDELLPFSFSRVSTDTVSVIIRGKRHTLNAVPLTPVKFNGTSTLSAAGRSLSGYVPVRQGMSGFQLMRETYSLLLTGDSVSYGALWSPLIEALARPHDKADAITIQNTVPVYANEPIEIQILSETTPALFADGVPITVTEDVLIDDVWHARFWSDRKGWHQLYTESDTTSLYVFDAPDWSAIRQAQQQTAHFDASRRSSTIAASPRVAAPWPPTAFWLFFLLSMGFLWLAPKL